MASVEQCRQALDGLATKLAEKDSAPRRPRRRLDFDRTLSCTVRDLAVTFVGNLRAGQLSDIAEGPRAPAQIRLHLDSDDLIKLVDGSLNVASSWATGRIKVEAGVRDMIKLMSIF